MWPDRTLLDLFAIDVPILQAPMAGASDAELAIAVAKAGGLGALPAGMLSGEQVRAQVEQFRAATKDKPLNLNFLAHKMPVPNNAREHAWREDSSLITSSSALIRLRLSREPRAGRSTQRRARSSKRSSPRS